MTANYLFRNQGCFRFEETGQIAGAAASADGGYKAGMGIACGDLDGDGLIDLAVTNYFGESTTFYRNLGQGFFADHTSLINMAAPTRRLLGFGIAFFDADNDGWLDVLSANGHVLDPRPQIPWTMPLAAPLGQRRRPRDRRLGTSRRALRSAAPRARPRRGRPRQRRPARRRRARAERAARSTCTTKPRTPAISSHSLLKERSPTATASGRGSRSSPAAAARLPSATAAEAISPRATRGFISAWATRRASNRSKSAGRRDRSIGTRASRPIASTVCAKGADAVADAGQRL